MTLSTRRPSLRITCPTGVLGIDTRIELVTRHGAIIDVSNLFSNVTWSMDASDGIARATFEALAVEVDVLGELTEITITEPDLQRALNQKAQQVEPEPTEESANG